MPEAPRPTEPTRPPLAGLGLVAGCALGIVVGALVAGGDHLLAIAGVGTALGLVAGAIADLAWVQREARRWPLLWQLAAAAGPVGVGTALGAAVGVAAGDTITGLALGFAAGVVAAAVLVAVQLRRPA